MNPREAQQLYNKNYDIAHRPINDINKRSKHRMDKVIAKREKDLMYKRQASQIAMCMLGMIFVLYVASEVFIGAKNIPCFVIALSCVAGIVLFMPNANVFERKRWNKKGNVESRRRR